MYYSHKFNQTPLFSFSTLGIDLTNDPLKVLADRIPWEALISEIEKTYSLKGRNSNSIRLMLGLEIAKTYFKGISDVQMIERLSRDIGIMYLCGFEYLVTAKQLPNSSSMSIFRSHLTHDVLDIIEMMSVEETLMHLPRRKRRQMSGDTTVLPVSVAYPTDASLVGKAVRKIAAFSHLAKGIVVKGKRKMLQSIQIFSKTRSHTKEAVEKHIQTIVSFAQGVIKQLNKKKVSLSRRERDTFRTIQKLFKQQQDKLDGLKIRDRIVSIDKAYLRPIFRGKAGKSIEIGLKAGMMCIGEKILMSTHTRYHNFSDTTIQKKQIQKYRKVTGHNPSEYSFDRGGDSDENHHYLANQKITDGIQCRGKERRRVKASTRKRLYNQRTHIERNIGHLKQTYGCDELNYKENNNPIRLSFAIMIHNYSI